MNLPTQDSGGDCQLCLVPQVGAIWDGREKHKIFCPCRARKHSMQVKKAGTKILGGKLVFTRDGMLPPHVVVPRVVAARPGSHKTGISPQIPHDECVTL